MSGKSQADMIREIHVSMFGVKGSEDRGLVGDVKSIDKQLHILNGSVRTNTAWRKALVWAVGFVVMAVVALSSAVIALANTVP